MEERQRPERTSTERKKGLSASNCVYTSCYCEENVWKLCEKIRDEQVEDLPEYYAVFISNAARQIPLWMQKQMADPLTPVVWDYHVILVRKLPDGNACVYDLDCILAFPCHLVDYANQVLRSNRGLKKQYHRKFRVIPASVFLSTFASDRSHMKRPNGEWTQEPPDYPPIRTAERACSELKRCGLKPFPVLHVSETSMRHPLKPVTLELRMDGEIPRDEKLCILCGDVNGFKDETDITSYEIGKNFISAQLNHFSIFDIAFIRDNVKWLKDRTLETIWNLLAQFSGPCYHVNFSQYYKLNDREYSYLVACCEECNLDRLDNRLEKRKYSPMDISQAVIYGKTRIEVKLDGCYQIKRRSQINRGSLKFMCLQLYGTVQNLQRVEESNSTDCELLIFQDGEEQPLITMPFSVPNTETPRNTANIGSTDQEQSLGGKNAQKDWGIIPWLRSFVHRVLPASSNIGARQPVAPEGSSESSTNKGRVDESSIEAILNNRDLLTRIANKLEQDSMTPLKELALLFGIGEPAQLTTAEPSRKFFTNLADSRRDITLADLQNLIEQILSLKRQSIFPPIKRAIDNGTVRFTLRITLGELRDSGQNWLFFLKNVADKLLENTFQLPSWKEVADYYDYDYDTIASFSSTVEAARPTFKLFEHLVFMENVPKISTLKDKLKALNRQDIIRLIEENQQVAYE